MRRPPKAHRGLILRTCAPDMTGYGGFRWPESGYVEAPDWDPAAECGRGLHGLLWGEGEGLTHWDGRWIVAEVDAREVVDLGRKVKVPRAWVLHVGDQQSATAYLAAHGGAGRAIVGGTATAGVGGTATAGYGGVIAVRWWDGQAGRYRMAVAEVGVGIEAGVPYHVVGGRLVRREVP